MNEIMELRWHGRGGQGSVTAAKLLAEAALREGKHIQAFPEYGPERTGAPVKSFNRISSEPIVIHCQIEQPKMVVVLDDTLIDTVDVCEGLKPGGMVVVNTDQSREAVEKKLNLQDGTFVIIDATQIALDKIGKNIPNTPMLGALVKLSGLVKLESVKEVFAQQYGKKFSSKVLEGNLEALDEAYNKV